MKKTILVFANKYIYGKDCYLFHILELGARDEECAGCEKASRLEISGCVFTPSHGLAYLHYIVVFHIVVSHDGTGSRSL